jgi:lipopolysaccharide biosynthesis glycosyltransferase
MFFHTFVAEDVDKLLYIDCDTVVCASLAPLLTLDMQGKAVAVVRDSLTTTYKTLLGFDMDDDYFNAGITFIDVNAWKEKSITERLLDHIQNVRSRYCNPDQDLLNIVLKDEKLILPPEYNFQPSHRAFSDKTYFSCYRHTSYYSHDELENARKNPVILHAYRFIGDFPWHKGNVHPDTPIFDDYMKRSPWHNYEKKKAGRGLIFAIEKLMYRLLPKKLFLKIFSSFTRRQFEKQNAAILAEMS